MDTEYEQGSYTGSTHHRHNGYYAGDFSDRPFPTVPLQALVAVRPQPCRSVLVDRVSDHSHH